MKGGPSPLVVPKIVCSLFTSHNFDHCANSHSLYRPQGAVVLLALSNREVEHTTIFLFSFS